MEKVLGKISHASFGICGYQDAALGLSLTFSLSGGSSGVSTTKAAWDVNRMECSEFSKWTEDDRDKQYVEIMRHLSDLLNDAKVTDVSKLVGIPVEVTLDNNTFKEFRILKEVL